MRQVRVIIDLISTFTFIFAIPMFFLSYIHILLKVDYKFYFPYLIILFYYMIMQINHHVYSTSVFIFNMYYYRVILTMSISNGSVAAESLTDIIVASNNLFQWTIRLYNKLHVYVCQKLCDMFKRNFFNVIVMDIRNTMATNSVSLEVFIHIYSMTINLF